MFFFSTDTVATIDVIQLPPRLSRSTDVIMELRYGMCERFFSLSDMITCNFQHENAT